MEAALCVGDRLRVGSAFLMVTEPRTPCYRLRFDRDDTIKRFLTVREAFSTSQLSRKDKCRRERRSRH